MIMVICTKHWMRRQHYLTSDQFEWMKLLVRKQYLQPRGTKTEGNRLASSLCGPPNPPMRISKLPDHCLPLSPCTNHQPRYPSILLRSCLPKKTHPKANLSTVRLTTPHGTCNLISFPHQNWTWDCKGDTDLRLQRRHRLDRRKPQLPKGTSIKKSRHLAPKNTRPPRIFRVFLMNFWIQFQVASRGHDGRLGENKNEILGSSVVGCVRKVTILHKTSRGIFFRRIPGFLLFFRGADKPQTRPNYTLSSLLHASEVTRFPPQRSQIPPQTWTSCRDNWKLTRFLQSNLGRNNSRENFQHHLPSLDQTSHKEKYKQNREKGTRKNIAIN